jgi:hypothetical protein
MVRVRSLRTQQRVKNRCQYAFVVGWLVWVLCLCWLSCFEISLVEVDD